MKYYHILPHTADVRILVQGATLSELFTNALLGMNEVLKKGFCKPEIKTSVKKIISLTGSDVTVLLIDFLSEVLTETQTNHFIYCRVLFNKLTNSFVEATVFGAAADNIDKDIKAVTYAEAQIVKNNRGLFETIIVFDV